MRGTSGSDQVSTICHDFYTHASLEQRIDHRRKMLPWSIAIPAGFWFTGQRREGQGEESLDPDPVPSFTDNK